MPQHLPWLVVELIMSKLFNNITKFIIFLIFAFCVLWIFIGLPLHIIGSEHPFFVTIRLSYLLIWHLIKEVEKDIQKLKIRNKSVEFDKSWETSLTRRTLLMIFTYLAIGVYLRAIDLPKPWLNAIVPAVAFMLSTLTLPFFKKIWLKSKK